MSRWVKQEDVIRKYAEMIADEAYWEYGVGNGKPDADDMKIAREYYSDLPTIDIVRCGECRWYKDFDGCFFSTEFVDADGFCSYGERKGE